MINKAQVGLTSLAYSRLTNMRLKICNAAPNHEVNVNASYNSFILVVIIFPLLAGS